MYQAEAIIGTQIKTNRRKMEIFAVPITNAPGEEKFIIFRPLIGLAFVGNRAMADIALSFKDNQGFPHSIDDNVNTFLDSIGFFNPDPPHQTQLGGEFQPTTVVPLLTNQCQLRCTYCYAAAGEAPQTELQIDKGRIAIDYVCKIAQRLKHSLFEVSFHGGGEPTYAWDVLRELVAHARQKEVPAKITLTTNGVWSLKQFDWIIANIDEFTISIDGRPETQDRQRPTGSGVGSSEIVMRTLRKLEEHSIPYGIRMTAIAPWENLPLDVDYLCEQTGCHSIQVEPAFNLGRGGHIQPDEADLREFTDAFIEAFEIAAQANRVFYYSGARLGVVAAGFCTAPYQALIVTPGGDLVTCYEVTNNSHPLADISVIGNIANGDVCLDHSTRDNLHKLLQERRTTCRECFCYWSCAGDCYLQAFEPGPSGHLIHSTRCDMNRLIMENLLLWNIEKSEGVWNMRRTRDVVGGRR